ncbi:SWR1-complex protein 5 [Coleophoma cylindrospora]|uniref:SWR1-complex protein 5 n=1 Tax=Coleophoma cylindrospora TaxID=1849047 RepID=A0A3D8SEG4_9HELO|nr:SWR1-complex protein 5 [Coleophoma cylindrospora]
MPPELIPDDDEYASSEDSDFAPEAGLAEASQDSGSESEADDGPSTTTVKKTAVKTKRRHSPDKEADDAGFENSGDEAIIERGLKKQKKRGRKGKEELDDEGGEGGLVKTRSMRAQEKGEKKILVDTSKATIDVDAVWASMISGKPATTTTSEVLPTTESKSQSPKFEKGQKIEPSNGRQASREPSTLSDGPDSMIMIKRTYNFAGKVHTEQKLVSRNSAEAKLYLASQKDNPSAETQPDSPFTKSKRPTKLARRSIFEPITEALPQRKDLHFGARKSDGALLSTVNNKDAKKLTTVEKSAMDWAGFVDKEGIADELDAAGKAKGAFRDRQEFLARVEGKREEEARRARLAGK